MDFTLYGTIVILHEFDDNDLSVTMTFKNEAETVTIGTVKIEQNRYRAFVEAIGLTGKIFFGDLAPNVLGHKVSMNKNELKTTVSFG